MDGYHDDENWTLLEITMQMLLNLSGNLLYMSRIKVGIG